MQQPYILIVIAALAIIVLLIWAVMKKKPQEKFSPLAGLAFALIITGMIFGENRLVGYGLIGAGVVLAIIDMVMKLKK